MIALAWLLALALLAAPPAFLWCCCGDCGTLDFTVTLCGAPLAGVVIDVTGPSGFSGTCTTNGSGQCSISISASGSYPWTATPPGGSGANGASGTKVVASCVAGSHNAVVVTLTAASGYSCSPPCCNEAGPPYLTPTWWSTLTLNDGLGSVTLNLLVGGSNPIWVGSATRTAGHAKDCNFFNGIATCTRVVTGQPVTIYFSVSCCDLANGKLLGSVGYMPCTDFDPACGTAGACPASNLSTPIAINGDPNCNCAGLAADGSVFPGALTDASGHNQSWGFGSSVSNGSDTDSCLAVDCPPASMGGTVTVTKGFATVPGDEGQKVAKQLAEVYGSTPGGVLGNVLSIALSLSS